MSPAIRIMLLIVSLPGLALGVVQIYNWYHQGLSAEFDLLSFVFGCLSVYLMLLVLRGKSPSFLNDSA